MNSKSIKIKHLIEKDKSPSSQDETLDKWSFAIFFMGLMGVFILLAITHKDLSSQEISSALKGYGEEFIFWW